MRPLQKPINHEVSMKGFHPPFGDENLESRSSTSGGSQVELADSFLFSYHGTKEMPLIF
jgi:hypothetical protein